MGYLANIKLVVDKEGSSSIVYENTEECETNVEALLWASKFLYENAMIALQDRINELD